MPLVSVLRIKNRWKSVFAMDNWDDVQAAYESMQASVNKLVDGADAVVDLGEVVLARFDNADVYEKKDKTPVVDGLPGEVAIRAFVQEASIDRAFAEKCLNAAPFMQVIDKKTLKNAEPAKKNDTIPAASALAIIEVPGLDNAGALDMLIDPKNGHQALKDLSQWLETAVKAPGVKGFTLNYSAVAIQASIETVLSLAIRAALEMKTRVSIAVGGKGTYPGMMWSAVTALNDMQTRQSDHGSFDWTIIRGQWDQDRALNRQETGSIGKPGTTMRPYPVQGQDAGTLAWFLALSEDLRNSRAQEAMSSGVRHGSAVARQASGAFTIQLDKYGIGPDGYISSDKSRVTPVFDLAEFMEIRASGGVG